jgi:type II secretory pathway pseudopilin PulG
VWLRRYVPEIIASAIVIGFLLAVIVPNLRAERQRRGQKRTMADMRTIATAWEARATDTETYAVRSLEPEWQCAPNCIIRDGRVPFEDLSAALAPTYIKTLPPTDGWGNPWTFRVSVHPPAHGSYVVRSTGSDGVRDVDLSDFSVGKIFRFEQDLLFVNGNFTRHPETSAVE